MAICVSGKEEGKLYYFNVESNTFTYEVPPEMKGWTARDRQPSASGMTYSQAAVGEFPGTDTPTPVESPAELT